MAKQHPNEDIDARDEQPATDTHTNAVSGDEVANAAAGALHGRRAVEEVRPQPDAVALDGDTLISDEGRSER